MSEENKVMNDVSTVEKKIETIVFKTLKGKIKGRIFVKMKDKENEDIDVLYIKIESNNLIYTKDLQLPGNTFDMVAQNDAFAETLGLMVYDDFKEYINNKFFVQDKPKRFYKREN